jgi:serine/threonine-protein kinase
MNLSVGGRLGVYEVVAPLGAGGMGEVWRARDTRLGREVALKVLPEAFARDPERLARFEREAKVLASLNHPAIAHIHGLEESDGTLALVMELVEGPTLAERLERGPLALGEALAVLLRIAEALESAHEKGIVHRDLKPQNVKVDDEGRVKVLDFGLAKALDDGNEGASRVDLGNSPTITRGATTDGLVLGTAAYMAPEQAKGRPVDRRADVWAFGVVAWECLTGRRLFAGDSVSETIAFLLTREPELDALPEGTPERVRNLLRRCLARDPHRRLQAIGDARIVLEEVLAAPDRPEPAARPAAAAPGSRLTRLLPWSIAALALAFAATIALRGRAPSAGADSPPRRLEITGISVVQSSGVAIAPDGSEVIGYDLTPGRPHLLRRRLAEFEVRDVPGTANGFNPFYSPDGRSIGFFSDNELCVLALAGGGRRCLAEAQGFATGAWGEDGTIVFSHLPLDPGVAPGLWRIPAAGGEAQRLTTADAAAGEREHGYPQVLPGGLVLYVSFAETSTSLRVVPLAGGAPRVLLDNSRRARYARSGHLLFWDDAAGELRAVAFDARRGELRGSPVALGVGDSTFSTGDSVPAFEISREGTLVYSVGGQFEENFVVVRVGADGQVTPLVEELGSWAQPRVSPDGRILLLRRAAQPDCSLWAFDLERRSLSRISGAGDYHNPIWSPDGSSILISRDFGAGTNRQVYRQPADGGEATPFARAEFPSLAESISADGGWLALTRDNRRDRNDIFLHDLRSGTTRPWLVTDADEDFPAISPDGELVAYVSNETGRQEVYVRPLAGSAAKYPISPGGGTGPLWARDGRALFYAEGERLLRVPIATTPRFHAGAPVSVFHGTEYVWDRPGNYDRLPDGDFVVVQRRGSPASERRLRVVLDLFAELERLAPTGGRT